MDRTTKLQRLAIKYQSATSKEERDRIFSEICQIAMRMPVVRSTHRKTYSRVSGQSPRFADEENQAIRRAIWRSLARYDASYNVPYSIYVTRGIKIALKDFWSQEAWREDVPMHIPVQKWREYRRAAAHKSNSNTPEPCIDNELYNACAIAPLHCEISELANRIYEIED